MSDVKTSKTAVVLLHYPIQNRAGQTIHTTITNLDIHDISRTCRTYEIDHYYLVNPIIEQHEMVQRILGYWKLPKSEKWHPDRVEALRRVQLVSLFEDVKNDLKTRYPELPMEVVMPDARPLPNQKSYGALREEWAQAKAPGLRVIVLGTGWGVAEEFFPQVNTFLGPIYGPLGVEGYNHLSVRAAAAVILDRLFGSV